MARAFQRRVWRSGLFAYLTVAGSLAGASGLQVTPTGLSLTAVQKADALYLSNSGDSTVHAQVRVYRWTQDGSGDHLTPSRELVVSPPMLQVDPNGQQMIRVIRTGAPPNGANAVEGAYRLAIDELPIDAPGTPGLHFVVHYSVPIFVQPAGIKETSPQLQWTLRREGEHVGLDVANQGNAHAQLAQLEFVDAAGRRTEVDPGLLGYVLPGATMHFALKPPAAVFASGGTLEIMVNGQKTTQNLSLAGRSP